MSYNVGFMKHWPNQYVLCPHYIAGYPRQIINRLAIQLQYAVISVVVYSREYQTITPLPSAGSYFTLV